MSVRKITMRVAFVVVIALVVGAVLSMPTLSEDHNTVGDSLTVESHQPDAILATQPSETGSVSVPGTSEAKHVVVDTGHGNDVDRSSLSPMIEALTAAGHEVTFYGGERDTSLNETLRSADAFVTIEAQQSFTAAERAGLDAFTDAGGRVLMATEPPSQSSPLLALFGGGPRQAAGTAPMTGLAASYGFSVGDGYVFDLERYDTNYRNTFATPTDGATVGADAEQVTLHEATTVEGGQPLLETTETSQLSTHRTEAARSTAARDGNVTVLGDASVLDSEWILRNDNEVFVSGVLEFLVTGDKESGVPAPPQSSQPGAGGPPQPGGTMTP